MDYAQLVAFERIVREGSFSRAAWSLNIAQPTISARIKTLEQELGGKLFERNNRRVTLTERGVNFLPHARQALAAMTDGLQAASVKQGGRQGHLTIGVLRSLTECLLGPTLATFHTAYPKVDYLIYEGRHEQIIGLLVDGQIELGLITWPCLTPPPVEVTPLLHFHEEVVLATGKDHPLAQFESVTQERLLEYADLFILCRWWQMTPDVIHHLAYKSRHRVDAPTGLGLYLLTQSLGIGFLPRTLILSELATGQVREIVVTDLPPIYRNSALVHLARNNALSQVATNFIATLEHQAKNLDLK